MVWVKLIAVLVVQCGALRLIAVPIVVVSLIGAGRLNDIRAIGRIGLALTQYICAQTMAICHLSLFLLIWTVVPQSV